jgi:hypothetical protein
LAYQNYWGQAPFFNNDAKKGAKQKMGPGPNNLAPIILRSRKCREKNIKKSSITDDGAFK